MLIRFTVYSGDAKEQNITSKRIIFKNINVAKLQNPKRNLVQNVETYSSKGKIS